MSGKAETFDDTRDLYQDIILDRSRNPRHMHRMDPFDTAAHGDNPLCGDRVEVRVKFTSGERLADIAFEARGCAISLASADLMAEALQGRTTAEARRLAKIFDALASTGETQDDDPAIDTLRPLAGVHEYRSRIKCATLPWRALVASLDSAAEGASHERA